MSELTATEREFTDSIGLPVSGMTCGACATRLQKALARAPGIHRAAVNFATERADVVFDPGTVNAASIADAVVKAGFEVRGEQCSLGVKGMTCSACAYRIEKALMGVSGVIEANVNLVLERADIKTVPGQTDLRDLSEAVEKAGFDVVLDSESDRSTAGGTKLRSAEQAQLRRDGYVLMVSSALTLPLVLQMLSMLVGWTFHLSIWVELLLVTPVQFVIGARFYRAAASAIRAGSGNMDVLVVLGTTTAYLYSLY